MGRVYPRANLYMLPPTHTSWNHKLPIVLSAGSPATCTMAASVGVRLSKLRYPTAACTDVRWAAADGEGRRADWLIGKSALVRLAGSPDAAQWAVRVERGLIRIATVMRLEVGYSARSGPDLRAGLSRPPLSAMPVQYQTPAIEDRLSKF